MKNISLVLVAWLIVIFFSIPVFIYQVIYHSFKFDFDEVSKYMERVAIGLDQLGSSIQNWDEDLTISAHIGRMKKDGTIKEPWISLCKVLNKLEINHCIKNIDV